MKGKLSPAVNQKHVLFMIAAVSVFQLGNIVISGALAQIAEAFPDRSATQIQLLMTLPDFAIICSTLLAGKLASSVQPRTMILAGLSCYVIAGLGGFFCHASMAAVYTWAFIIGVGRGFFITMASYLVTVCFTQEERPAALAVQSTWNNGGGIILTVLGGLLPGGAWYGCYLVYLLVIPVMLLGFFWLPRGTGPSAPAAKTGGRAPIHPCVYVFSLCAMLFLIVYNVYLTNCSMLYDELGFSNVPVMSGVSNGLMMLGGAVAALFYKRLSKKFGNFLITLGFLAMFAGLLLSCASRFMPIIMLGGFITGMSISLTSPQICMMISLKSAPERASQSMSVYLASIYIGGFISAPLITPLAACFSESVRARFFVGAALALLFAAVVYFLTRSEWVTRPAVQAADMKREK